MASASRKGRNVEIVALLGVRDDITGSPQLKVTGVGRKILGDSFMSLEFETLSDMVLSDRLEMDSSSRS